MGSRVEHLAVYLAGQLSLDEDDRDVIRFGLELVVSTALSLGATLTLALAVGVVKPVLAALLVFTPVRTQAGGAHNSSPGLCAVVTALTFTLLGWLAMRVGPWVGTHISLFLGGSFVVALVANHLWAPVETPNKPISRRQREKLRRRTLVALVAVTAALTSLAMMGSQEVAVYIAAGGLALLVQSLVISTWGIVFFDKMDKVLSLSWARRR
ncbi:hypothetical protein SY88_14560 [Clostridiales bacterium PH28_bin88]|nr:hypothetical protein SY88_14560 [Clostridiales bacterium PH28_bin88]